MVAEGDTCQLSASFTCHSKGPIQETSAYSTEFESNGYAKKSVFDSQCLKSEYVCYPRLFTLQSVLLLYILKGQAKKFEFINHKAILYNNLSFTLSSLAPMPQPDQRLGTYRQPKVIFFRQKFTVA